MKIKTNKCGISLLLIFLIFNLGCYGSKESNDTEDRKNIDFIVKMRSGDYWDTVKMGADEAAKEFNVNLNFTAPDSESDIKKQQSLVQEAIDKKSDALILAASDYNALVQVTEKASSRNIPVIMVDSEVNTKQISSLVSTNNYEAGKKAGDKLINIVGPNSRIAIMSFVKESRNAEERESGVYDILDKYPSVNVVAKEYCLSDQKLAYEMTKDMISRDSNIDGILALNSIASIGVAQAVDELGFGGRIKIIAFDSTEEEVQYIEHGVIQATIIQNPFSMGYLGVKYAAMAARGQKIPKNFDTGTTVIDKENMYLPENEKLVFPLVK